MSAQAPSDVTGTVEARGQEPAQWPSPIVENFAEAWPDLSNSVGEQDVENWVLSNRRILIRTATWNLCAKPPPDIQSLRANLLPTDRFHAYVIGTEECERSIAQSALNPSKKTWEAFLKEAIGPNYIPIRSHTLQAIHLMVFVHRKIAHLCSVVTSAAVPTGMGSTLGNKGGVGLFFKVGDTRFLIVNAHLAAHQTAENRRNAEFNRINKMIPVLLEKKEASVGSTRHLNKPVSKSSASTPTKSSAPSGIDATVATDTAPSPTRDVPTVVGAVDNTTTGTSSSHNTNTDAPTGAAGPASGAPELHVLETVVNNVGEIVEVVDRCESTEGAPTPSDAGNPVSASSSVAPEQDLAPPASLAALSTEEPPELPSVIDGIAADEAFDNSENAVTFPNEADNTINSVLESNMYNVNEADNLVDETAENEVGSNADVNVVNKLDGTAILDVTEVSGKTLENTADFVVFMGDLNYRIKGNRKIVSSLVANNMHEVLLHNDQLAWNMARGLVLQNFTEGPLNFKPTYKYDVGTDVYDTSSKGRIPSWTDRILYIPRAGVQCLAYNADDSVMTSDHRPVYASFSVDVQLPEGYGSSTDTGAAAGLHNQSNATDKEKKLPEFTSESQVCTIM